MDSIAKRTYINLLKGWAVFLMLWGHCIQFLSCDDFDCFEDPVFKIIYSFHMPLFMLVSGYLFHFSLQKRTLPQILVHRTQAMLQPIIAISIIAFFTTTVPFSVLQGNRKIIFSGEWVDNIGSELLWFLWSVLACSVLVAICFKAVQSKFLRVCILIAGVVFVALFPNGEKNVFMYPYFILGFVFCRYEQKLTVVWKAAQYISLPVYPVLAFFMKREHFIYTSGLAGDVGLLRHMPVNLYRWALGLAGSLFMMCCIRLVFTVLNAKPFGARILAPADKLGQKSLQVYALSVIILSEYIPFVYQQIVNIIGSNILNFNHILYDVLWTPLIAVGVAVLLVGITKLLELLQISKIIFGR